MYIKPYENAENGIFDLASGNICGVKSKGIHILRPLPSISKLSKSCLHYISGRAIGLTYGDVISSYFSLRP